MFSFIKCLKSSVVCKAGSYHLALRTTSPCWNIVFSTSRSIVQNERSAKHETKSIHPSMSMAENLVNRCPRNMQPYLKLMRVDRPIGTWLLFWPCGWGAALATAPGSLPPLDILALMLTGAFIMRGAGCTINDMWDQKIDRKVERTKSRPLASGQIPLLHTWIFLGAQLSVGLAILLQLNWYTILLGASSLSLVVTYPLMKRVTYWPQMILGMAFNWGTLVGYSAVHGHCNWSVCLPLYTAGIAWTLVYDTIYAHQDKLDDIKVGVKSTALRFGENTPLWLSGFSLAMISSLIAAGSAAQVSWPYYATVAATGAHLFHQIATLKMDQGEDCAKKFKSNKNIGALLFLGCVLGTYWRSEPVDNKANTQHNQIV